VRAAIVGRGLIGGSIGAVLRQKKQPSREIAGYSRRRRTPAEAFRPGGIERGETHLRKASKQAEFLVNARRVFTSKEVLSVVPLYIRSGCVVTDTASTGAQGMERAAALLRQTANFADRHPAAARGTHGIMAVEAEPVQGHAYCPGPAQPASPESIDKATSMVKKSGALLFIIDAAEHHSTAADISRSRILHSAGLVSSKQGKNG